MKMDKRADDVHLRMSATTLGLGVEKCHRGRERGGLADDDRGQTYSARGCCCA